MKSKEEMIETMADAIRVADDLPCTFDCGRGNSCVQCALAVKQAEAALKALCGALPDVPEITFNVDGRVHTNIDVYELEDIYDQLKQWGK